MNSIKKLSPNFTQKFEELLSSSEESKEHEEFLEIFLKNTFTFFWEQEDTVLCLDFLKFFDLLQQKYRKNIWCFQMKTQELPA